MQNFSVNQNFLRFLLILKYCQSCKIFAAAIEILLSILSVYGVLPCLFSAFGNCIPVLRCLLLCCSFAYTVAVMLY